MQLGWVDFSKEERNQVMQTLKLLDESTALDELGIGIIRDGYADILFPGTSTIQTRAKYFILIPYIFEKAEKESFKRRSEILPWVNHYEDKLVKTLVENSEADEMGIIGKLSYKQGKTVKTKPSSIYWNGMRTFEILKDENISIGNVCDIIYGKISRRNAVTIKTEGETFDDITAANENIVIFSPITPDYNIENDTKIELTNKEAVYLYDKITNAKRSKDSLLSFLIKNKFSFPSFDEIDPKLLPSNIRHDYLLARSFADFIIGAHLRYNVIYSNEQDIEQMKAYEEWFRSFKFSDFNLMEVILRITSNYHTNTFLKDFYVAAKKNDLEAADKLIINREKSIKQDRAKLRKPSEYRYEKPVHNYKLDYRYSTVKTIIDDIIRGLEA